MILEDIQKSLIIFVLLFVFGLIVSYIRGNKIEINKLLKENTFLILLIPIAIFAALQTEHEVARLVPVVYVVGIFCVLFCFKKK